MRHRVHFDGFPDLVGDTCLGIRSVGPQNATQSPCAVGPNDCCNPGSKDLREFVRVQLPDMESEHAHRIVGERFLSLVRSLSDQSHPQSFAITLGSPGMSIDYEFLIPWYSIHPISLRERSFPSHISDIVDTFPDPFTVRWFASYISGESYFGL